MSLSPGTRITARKDGTFTRGTVITTDPGHYHATVNGWTVYHVAWDGGSVGSGWTDRDLTPVSEAPRAITPALLTAHGVPADIAVEWAAEIN